MDKQEIIEGNKLIAEFMGFSGYQEKGHVNPFGEYHSSWEWLIPVWTKFWNEANEFCFGAAKAKQYEDLRNIRVIFMACIDNGDIANASRIMADSIKWLNSQKQ